MKLKTLLPLLLVTFVFLGASCKKDERNPNQNSILGTWISTDKTDTLYFTDSMNLYHSNANMHYDHYNYQFFNDSLKIGYSGRLYIYVFPTMHHYLLNGNELNIDFTNKSCYGFGLVVINYRKN